MIVDGKVRKMKFSERVRENFERFKEIVERKGRDVLVAGIIGAGVLVGGVKAQSADSLVVDTSSVHIDSTYIDWSKPRFMGLTYGYYKKEDELLKILGGIYYDIGREYGIGVDDIVRVCRTVYAERVNNFPYSTPIMRADTIEAIKWYFLQYYGYSSVVGYKFSNEGDVTRYIQKHPNRAAAFLYDLGIIKSSQYWVLLSTEE
jgi:hypothetical protein